VKVVANHALATRRKRQATLLSLFGLGVLMLGLYLNFTASPLAAYVALVVGSVASWIGIALADRWVRPPRADRALESGLKTAGRPFSLYHWVLPADHVLAAPWGLSVFVVANVDGRIEVTGTKWREARPLWRRLFTLGRRPLGNPAALAATEIELLRAALAAAGVDDVPIDAAVLLSHPSVELAAEGSSLPALRPEDLSAWLRRQQRGKAALSPTRRRQLDVALDAMAGSRLSPPPREKKKATLDPEPGG
jgi:hypothetical protein